MRVLFFEPYAINVPHFGTCLELMIDYLKKGDEVWFLGCESDFKSCDVNTSHKIDVCLACRDRGLHGLNRISKYGKINFLRLKGFIDKNDSAALVSDYQFSNIDELKKLSFREFYDLGYSVASSIISMYRDPAPDTVIISDLINAFIHSSKLAYIAVDKAINKIKPDRVYAYNGRYAILRPALRACQKNGTEIFLNEVGSDLSKYLLTKNELLHDVVYIQKEIDDFWNESIDTVEEKNEKAHEYYSLTKNGISKTWHSYTNDQKRELPSDWDENDYNVVFFTSSEDEFAAIGDDWVSTLYKTQDEGIKRIGNDLVTEKNVKVWVRLHPNLKSAPEKLLTPYLDINNPIVRIILPTEIVSTYLLMEMADKIVTFGSSMGIEAAFWGKVSIMLGMSWYKGLGSTYEPKDHEEVLSLILNNELKPLDRTAAIKYGYYLGLYGTAYKHFRKTGIYTGTIEGWDFSPSKKLQLINKLRSRGILTERTAEKVFNFLID